MGTEEKKKPKYIERPLEDTNDPLVRIEKRLRAIDEKLGLLLIVVTGGLVITVCCLLILVSRLFPI